jgi:site-specific DNA recombinase
MDTKTEKYAVYGRYSSVGQNDKSAEDQIFECSEYVEAKGGEVVDVYPEKAISGGMTFRRDEYQRLLADIPTGKFNVLIAESLDRIARNTGDLAKLHELLQFHGIRLVTLSDGDDISELDVAIKGYMGAQYLKDLSKKTKRGHRGRIREGMNPGSCPYGFRSSDEFDPVAKKKITGVLIKNDYEIDIIIRMFIEFAEGQSPGKIARRLNKENIPGPKGRPWRDGTIRYILRNPTYSGIRIWNRKSCKKDPLTGKYVVCIKPEDEWIIRDAPELRIIEDNLWKSVQARWEEINSKASNICISNALTGKRRVNYMLSGLLFCSECEVKYTLGSKNRYNCSRYKKGECTNGKSIMRQVIENHVLDVLLDKMLAPERLNKVLDRYRVHLEEVQQREDTKNNVARKEIGQIDKDLDAYMRAIAQGIDALTIHDRIKALEARKKELQKSIKRPCHINVPDEELLKQYRELLNDLSGNLDDDNVRYKAMNVIRPLIDKIILFPTDDGLRAELHGKLGNLLQIRTDKKGNFFYIPESDIESSRTSLAPARVSCLRYGIGPSPNKSIVTKALEFGFSFYFVV